MRTTVRIDDDLLRELKKRAKQEDASLTQLVNQAIRRGLEPNSAKKRAPKFRQQTESMGPPLIDVTKALSIAYEWEDEEILRKMALGK